MMGTMAWRIGAVVLLRCWLAGACSSFMMSSGDDSLATISARTMDLGYGAFSLAAVPRGQGGGNASSSLGYVGAYAVLEKFPKVGVEQVITAGINEAGLSCDMQTLEGSSYPPYPGPNARPVMVGVFCTWVLSTFRSVDEVHEALASGAAVVYGPDGFAQHFVVRDATGVSLVAEFVDQTTRLYLDGNDNGETGFGIMTNEPEFPFHLTNAQHLEWKLGLARPAVNTPGNFYPDERFLRLHLLKSALEVPSTEKEKIMQAVHLLNSVTVPPGQQRGTDSGSAEGMGDHTVFAFIYDHVNAVLYFRSAGNQSLQRVRLADLDLQAGSPTKTLAIENDLDWYVNAAQAFTS
uniref:Choloylglycine hydrolase/NAAA C-terminal domain-containing protein n=1 Tax=Rhizochromulina marina TaxID=1034831 RepID=A0A6U1CY85_9STRA|mmetsp:Transcript_6101/g.17827  ORF Transcript_6101/g.17827 Transcript_6101/m.17827 type:complete len:349 (+) Transcript_6101:13-1059(+)